MNPPSGTAPLYGLTRYRASEPEEIIMTKSEAKRYVREHDDDTADLDDLPAVFAAIFGREPDMQDRRDGLWSHCCAAVL